MDPTFAGHMRRYLATLIAEHRATDAGPCACGDPLDDGSLADHVLDVMTAAFAEPALAPHVVSVDGAEVVTRRASKAEGRAHRGHANPAALSCPDCSSDLVSRGFDLICPRVDRETTVRGDLDAGRVVACGAERSDG